MPHDPEKYLHDIRSSHGLQPETVWNAIEEKLPALMREVQTLLKESGAEPGQG